MSTKPVPMKHSTSLLISDKDRISSDLFPKERVPEQNLNYLKARILYNFTADGENELSLNQDDIVEIIKDLDDDDEGWTLVSHQGIKGIIPTQFYEGVSHDYKIPVIVPKFLSTTHQWKIHLALKSFTNLQTDAQLKGPVSITWHTRKKTGNTGKVVFPSESTVAPINKTYDMVEEFIPSDKPGIYKGKFLRIQVKYNNAEPEVLAILLNSHISVKDSLELEKEVPVKWSDEHPNCHLVYTVKTTPIK